MPKSLYDEGMALVKKGLFSNFSDLVRSGIRSEFKEMRPVIQDLDRKHIYGDERLVHGVQESIREARAGKGKILKNDKEMDEYFEAL